MPSPGAVYYLPPQEGESVDSTKGDRPHLVLSLCEPGSEVVTLAYGSTKATEAAHGAAHVLVDPFAAAYHGTGLSALTYFYPSRLVSYVPEDLGPPAGRIRDEMTGIRAALRRALGFGSGPTQERNHAGSNRRGRIVTLARRMRAMSGFMHALVVTEPGYSRRSRQQTLLPVFSSDEFETRDLDVIVPSAAWTRAVTGGTEPVIVAVPMVFTVYEPVWIDSYLSEVVDAETLQRIDEALALHFGL